MFGAPHVGEGGIYEDHQKQHISILNTESAELQCQMNANPKKLWSKKTGCNVKWTQTPKNFDRKKRTSLHQTTSQEVEILARSVSKSITIKRHYYDWPYVFAWKKLRKAVLLDEILLFLHKIKPK